MEQWVLICLWGLRASLIPLMCHGVLRGSLCSRRAFCSHPEHLCLQGGCLGGKGLMGVCPTPLWGPMWG